MNQPMITPRIALVVVNTGILRQGCAPHYSFDGTGGTIGCQGAGWMLSDNRERIQPIHCEIVLDEGSFCIVDRSGHTRINSSSAALGLHVSARLADGDILHIGPYRVSVHLHDQQHALPDPSRHLIQYGVGELLNIQNEHIELFEELSPNEAPESPSTTEKDLLEAWLSDDDGHLEGLDPLHALEAKHVSDEILRRSLIEDIHHGMSASGTQADLAATRFEAITGQPVALPGVPGEPHRDIDQPDPVISDPGFEQWLGTPEQVAQEIPSEAPESPRLPEPEPRRIQLHDAALTHAINSGLDALQQSVPSRPDLATRFWDAFQLAYEQAQRAQRMEAP